MLKQNKQTNNNDVGPKQKHTPLIAIPQCQLDTGVVQFGLVFIVLNTTFNIILFAWWQSVLLVEENGVPGENHRSIASQ